MDLKNPRLMYLKAALFVVLGILASVGVVLIAADMKEVILLVLAIWSFCRAYYFAFYVIEHYIDPGYRFAGLWSSVRYLLRGRSR